MLNTPGATAPSAGQPAPELGHLKAAAERLSQVNYNLATFYTRFFGPQPETADGAKQAETNACYRNDISSLFDEINRLETLVSNLTAIG